MPSEATERRLTFLETLPGGCVGFIAVEAQVYTQGGVPVMARFADGSGGFKILNLQGPMKDVKGTIYVPKSMWSEP